MRHLKDGKKQGPYESYIDNTGLDHTQTSNEPGTKQREDKDKNMTRKGQDMEKTVNQTDMIGITNGEYRHTTWTSKEGKHIYSTIAAHLPFTVLLQYI